MSFETSLIIIPLLIGPIFILIGLMMMKFPPKKINALYGYRTSASMKSQERWDFAQRYSAKEMVKAGALLALASVSGLIFKPEEGFNTLIGLGLTLVSIIILLTRTEKAIRLKFGKE